MATEAQAPDIEAVMKRHDDLAGEFSRNAKRLEGYRDGEQALSQLGIAVPPDLQRFVTIVNWPGSFVEALVELLVPQGFILPGQAEGDDELWEGWESNDMESEAPKVFDDALTYGRGFMALGTNEDDPDHPLITAESPNEMSVDVDTRTRKVTSAMRAYEDDANVQRRTIYLPNSTLWKVNDGGEWKDEFPEDNHDLGVVPVVPFFNRLKTGRWDGITEMRDIIPLVDACARALTNLQVGQETHAVPARWAAGLSKGDFADKDGNILPTWKAYFGAIWATQNKDAKFGQFSASDLRNFHETVKLYALLVAGVTGMSAQQLGFQTDNPASADGIKATERRLVTRAELRQAVFGNQLGRVMAIYKRLKSGDFDGQNRISTMWRSAATPNSEAVAQAALGLHGAGVLSTEGVWDEMGWSEPRKKKERERLEAQRADPALQRIADTLGASIGNGDDGAAGVEDVPA